MQDTAPADSLPLRRQLWRALGLMLTSPCYGMAYGALFPLTALALAGHGQGSLLIGTAASAFYAGSFTGALSFGQVVRRLGFRRGYVVASLIGALAAASLALDPPVEAWLGLRFLSGYAAASYYVAADSWLGGLASVRTRGRLMGSSESLRIAAMAAGPWLLLVAPSGPGFLVAAGILLASILPVLRTPEPAPAGGQAGGLPGIALVQRHGRLLALIGANGLVLSAFNAHAATSGLGLGLDTERVAIMISIAMIVGGFSQIGLGAAADLLGRMRVTAAVCGAGAVLALAAAPGLGAAWVVILGGLGGGLGIPIYSLGIQRLLDLAGPRELVAATSGALIAYNIGAAAGPLVAAAVIAGAGPSGLFLMIGATLALAAALAAFAPGSASRPAPETIVPR